MSENSGGIADFGQRQEHQPRHAAPDAFAPEAYQPRHAERQLDDELLERLALAADEYRYDQMHRQYTAEYAVEYRRLTTDSETHEDKEFIASQYVLVAKSLGRQAAAKEYADGLRSQLYYAPDDGVYYHGRHRLEDWDKKPAAQPYRPKPGQPPPETKEETRPPPTPPPGVAKPSRSETRGKGAITGLDILTAEDRSAPPAPPIAPPPERRGLVDRIKTSWYAGWAAVSTYFMHPEKGRRRRTVAQVAAVLGIYAGAATVAWLTGHKPGWENPEWLPPVQQEAPPHTEQFFDTLQAQGYNGESYEWGAFANQMGEQHATPELLETITAARAKGLDVDTWGDTASSTWGISSVTVQLADGMTKSYYDTPHKLAILQWYASGAGQG